MKNKKGYLYLVIASAVLLLYMFVSVFFIFIKQPNQPKTPTEPSPILTAPSGTNIPPLDIAKGHNTNISDQDLFIRNQLIANSPFGETHTTNAYRIIYMEDEDVFQVRIPTTDIETAKADAISWFRSQGISKKGICSLPVIFYITPRTLEQLRKEGQVFNPLPEGC